MENDLSDEDFVPFLKNLGLESYNVSLTWLFSDPSYSGILSWLYNNLDHCNALSPRESYRYSEIENSNSLLSSEELEQSLSSVKDDYPGLILPGDKESLEHVQLQTSHMKERIQLLEKHEETIAYLMKQSKSSYMDLKYEHEKLNVLEKQYKDEMSTASQDCLSLAAEVEGITDDVVHMVAGTIAECSSAHLDEDLSKKFMIFGPFEAYKQSQRLFKSHFDLYTSRKFNKKQTDICAETDVRKQTIEEAKDIEKRLYTAINDYVDSLAEMNGIQAMIDLLNKDDYVHPAQIAISLMESKSAVELLEQEESILKKQVENAAKNFVEKRTRVTAESAARVALAQREEIYKDLSWLVETTQTALSVDNVLYYALRHELQNMEDMLQFAADLKDYVLEEQSAVAFRIDAMKNICTQHEIAKQKLESGDILIDTVFKMFGVNTADGLVALEQKQHELKTGLLEIRDDIASELMKKEHVLETLRQSIQPLREYINKGSTKQPNCWDVTVVTLTRSVKGKMAATEEQVRDVIKQYVSVKNGDKHSLRKLWQWFLTDKPRFISKIQSYS